MSEPLRAVLPLRIMMEMGDMDIFIGGRVSKQYPLSPNSYLLKNNKGVFDGRDK